MTENQNELGNENQANTNGRIRGIGKKVVEYIKFAKVELIIIFTAIFIDLLTKFLIDRTMVEGELNELVPNFLNFRYMYNDKAAFGSAFGLNRILGDEGVLTFFIIFSVVSLIAFVYCMYRFRNHGWLVRISSALVIGGAIGNLYDRIVYGYVRDFIEFVFFGAELPILGKTFAIFNIADACLVIGMILLMYFFVFKFRHDLEEDKKSESLANDSKSSESRTSEEEAG